VMTSPLAMNYWMTLQCLLIWSPISNTVRSGGTFGGGSSLPPPVTHEGVSFEENAEILNSIFKSALGMVRAIVSRVDEDKSLRTLSGSVMKGRLFYSYDDVIEVMIGE
jgi:hypothetical protein